MRIAVVGAGVSGMMAAWFLQDEHEVTLFDREPFLGGHAHTFPVSLGAQTVYAETGARFFFDVSFPYLLALLRLLDVPLRWCPTHISFVDRPHRHTVVLPPRSPRHVLSLLRSARMLRHVLQLRRLAESADQVVRDRDWSMTLSEYLRHNHYSPSFGPEFIFPFISASWGAPLAEIPQFPIYSLLSVMRRSPGREAGTYEIDGGISVYTETLGKRLTRTALRLGTSIRRIREESGFVLEDEQGQAMRFDRLVLATSARDAARLLADVPAAAGLHTVARSFRHFETEIVIHGDPSFMPAQRHNWSMVNLFNEGDHTWMTDWSGWRDQLPVFRTWMPPQRPAPTPLYCRRAFHHLIMNPENRTLQKRMAELQGRDGIWLIGMYSIETDSHESALKSALVPARELSPQSPAMKLLLEQVHRNQSSPDRAERSG